LAGITNATVLAGRGVEIALGGSGGPAGATLGFQVTAGPGQGRLSATNGTLTQGKASVTYTANTNASGTDQFAYVVMAGTNRSAPATVRITIQPNTPPAFAGLPTGPLTLTNGEATVEFRVSQDVAEEGVRVWWTNATAGLTATLTSNAVSGASSLSFRLSVKAPGPGTYNLDLAADDRVNPLVRQRFTGVVPDSGGGVDPGVLTVPQVGLKLVWMPGLPGGGDWDAQRAGGAWVGLYEVTQGEYERVTGGNPSTFNPAKLGAEWSPDLPVETVTWEEAREFCRLLTARFGTELKSWRFGLPTLDQRTALEAALPAESLALIATNTVNIKSRLGHPVPANREGYLRIPVPHLLGNVAELLDHKETGDGSIRCGGGDFDNVAKKGFWTYLRPNERSSTTGFRVVLVPPARP
jgi:hypothetical protein